MKTITVRENEPFQVNVTDWTGEKMFSVVVQKPKFKIKKSSTSKVQFELCMIDLGDQMVPFTKG